MNELLKFREKCENYQCGACDGLNRYTTCERCYGEMVDGETWQEFVQATAKADAEYATQRERSATQRGRFIQATAKNDAK